MSNLRIMVLRERSHFNILTFLISKVESFVLVRRSSYELENHYSQILALFLVISPSFSIGF